MSGQLGVASIDKVCHATKDDRFSANWIELRGDVLVFSATGACGTASKIQVNPKQVAFCAKVEPPSAAVCHTPEMRAVVQKLLAKKYLAVYTPDSENIWLELETDQDLARWHEVCLRKFCRPCELRTRLTRLSPRPCH
jgi:hypothetical protein